MVRKFNKEVLRPLKAALPKDMVGKKARIFGVTRGSADLNPSTWSVNKIKGKGVSNIEVQGHAHSVKLSDPRFDKIDVSKMWNTRGYIKPKKKYENLHLTPRGLETFRKTGKPNYKDRYAFIEGNVKDLKEYDKLQPAPNPSNKNAKYKSGRLYKRSIYEMQQGKQDYYGGMPMKNKSHRQLIGREEYNELTDNGKKKLPKGKYYLASEVQLEPNGKMLYYSEPKNFFLIDF